MDTEGLLWQNLKEDHQTTKHEVQTDFILRDDEKLTERHFSLLSFIISLKTRLPPLLSCFSLLTLNFHIIFPPFFDLLPPHLFFFLSFCLNFVYSRGLQPFLVQGPLDERKTEQGPLLVILIFSLIYLFIFLMCHILSLAYNNF